MNTRMDQADFQRKMTKLLQCNKTKIAYNMEDSEIFVKQLRDYELVTEDFFKNAIKMRSNVKKQDGVYKILDDLEKDGWKSVKRFWICVFKDHILERYPVIQSLRDEVHEEFMICKKIAETKRKRDAEGQDNEKPGPSSLPSYSQKQPAKKPKFSSVQRKITTEQEMETKRKEDAKGSGNKKPGPSSLSTQKIPAKKPTSYDNELLVTCGDKEGVLYKDKLARGIKCIKSNGRWYTTPDFERFGGRGNSRNWKQSICSNGIPLKTRIDQGKLMCPRAMKRNVRKTRRVRRRRILRTRIQTSIVNVNISLGRN